MPYNSNTILQSQFIILNYKIEQKIMTSPHQLWSYTIYKKSFSSLKLQRVGSWVRACDIT